VSTRREFDSLLMQSLFAASGAPPFSLQGVVIFRRRKRFTVLFFLRELRDLGWLAQTYDDRQSATPTSHVCPTCSCRWSLIRPPRFSRPFPDPLHSTYALQTHRVHFGDRPRRLSNQQQHCHGQDGPLTTSRPISLFALFTRQCPPVTTR
jgi:hypothetical protein